MQVPRGLVSESLLASMRGGLASLSDEVLQETGDVATALLSAKHVLEAEYFVPYLEHATMEPMNCTALVTDNRFEVWAPTQTPERAIKVAAEVAGLSVKRGVLHVTQIGGGFGRRLKSDFVAQAVQIAKAMKGTPIKLLWSREDTTRHGFYRPANLSLVALQSTPRGMFPAELIALLLPLTVNCSTSLDRSSSYKLFPTYWSIRS